MARIKPQSTGAFKMEVRLIYPEGKPPIVLEGGPTIFRAIFEAMGQAFEAKTSPIGISEMDGKRITATVTNLSSKRLTDDEQSKHVGDDYQFSIKVEEITGP